MDDTEIVDDELFGFTLRTVVDENLFAVSIMGLTEQEVSLYIFNLN